MNCPQCRRPVDLTDVVCPHCGDILLALPPDTRLYQRYRLIRALHRSGGLSYQALDENQQQQVLILEFFPPGSRRLGALALLPESSREELTAWGERIKDAAGIAGMQQAERSFEQNGTHYVVTSLPVGESLLERLRSGRSLDPEQVQAIMLTLSRSLEALHARGVVDGLIGPERVALVAGSGRLDFGWGKRAWPAAVAPEQHLTPPNPQAVSDVYSLGATMLAALTGSAVPGAAERAFGQQLPAMPASTPIPLRQAIEMSLALRVDQRPDSAALVRLLSSNGQQAVTASSAKAEAPQVTVFQAQKGWITALAADDTQVVTAGTDLRLKIFDWRGQQQRTLDVFDSKPVGLAITPMGLVCGEQGGRVLVWNGQHISSGQATSPITQLQVRQANHAVTLHDDGQLGAWDLTGPRFLGKAPLPGVFVSTLYVAPGDRILIGTGQGEVMIFDDNTMRLRPLWEGEERLPVSAISSGEGQLLMAVGFRVLALAEGKATTIGTFPGTVQTMSLSPDRRTLAVGTGSGLHVVQLADQKIKTLWQGAAVHNVCWNAQGLAAGNAHGELILVSFPEGIR